MVKAKSDVLLSNELLSSSQVCLGYSASSPPECTGYQKCLLPRERTAAFVHLVRDLLFRDCAASPHQDPGKGS